MNKVLSGRFILTVISGLVFAYAVVTKLIRQGLTEINRMDNSIRKSDTTNKMVDELRGC